MTTSKTFYPNIISETSCNSCRDWNDKSNLKKAGDYAQCGSGSKTIAGKSGTHKNPSALTLTNFKISIPTGSLITKIKVEYAHQKVAYQGSTPNIPAPTISLVNVSGKSTTGATPTTTMSEKSVSFSFKPATSKITSSSFGVKINYPANANGNPGYLRLKYVRVIVIYTEPKYSVSISKAESNTKYVGDTLNLNVGINNLNKVDYNPSVTITLPSGVTFNSKVSGTGSFTKSGNNVVWNPSLSSSKASSTAVIKVNLTSEGNKTVTIKETLKNTSSKVTITVNKKEVVAQETQTTTTTETSNIDTNPPDEPQTPEDPQVTPIIFEMDQVTFDLKISDEILETMSDNDSIKFKAFIDEVDVSNRIWLPQYTLYLTNKSWKSENIQDNVINMILQPLEGIADNSKVLIQIKAYVYTPGGSGLDILLGGNPG